MIAGEPRPGLFPSSMISILVALFKLIAVVYPRDVIFPIEAWDICPFTNYVCTLTSVVSSE
jgi:hypothetical protein